MTKKKSTKRALISSLLILAMCFTMLAGTTFAWFTDEVTSGNNLIVSGKLDLQLQYGVYDDQTQAFTWSDVTSATKLFDDNALYEPGYTQVAYVRVKNAGTLALKYKLAANVVSETKGTNVFDEEFALSDYLKFGTANVQAAYADRAAAIADVDANATALKGATLAEGNVLEAGQEVGPIAVVIYMPTTVGNQANYKADAQPSITLGLTAVATQAVKEADAFDDQYDANAVLPTIVNSAAGFTAAIGDPSTNKVVLDSNVTVDGPQTISGKTIDGNGNTITVSNTGSDCGLNAKSGTIENVTVVGTGRGIGTGSSGTYKMDGDLYLDNVTVDGPTYGINIGKGEGNKLIATNSTINGWNSMDDVEGTFTNCTFGKASQGAGANYAVWAIYDTITFNNCAFKDGYQFFGRSTTTGVLTLNNCTHDGVAVTAANFASLFDAVHDSDFDYIKNQMTVIVNGETVTFA